MSEQEPKKRGRGRPPGSKNKPKDAKAQSQAAGTAVEHAKVHLEDLTEQEEYVLTMQHQRHYEEALEAKKKANADFLVVCRAAKAELGDKVIEKIKLNIALQTDAGKKALEDRMSMLAMIGRWNGLGVQIDMFGEEPIEDQKFAEGKRAGMAGDAASPPHGLTGLLQQKWLEGYHAGQDINRQALERRVAKVGDDFTALAPKDGEETEAEKNGTYYMGLGRVAFEHGHDGTVPSDIPEQYRDNWSAGWGNAKAASKHLVAA